MILLIIYLLSFFADEVVFSCKNKKPVHPELTFNGTPIARESFTQHIGVYLDSRLNFSKHIKGKATKRLSLSFYPIMWNEMCSICPIKCTYGLFLIMEMLFITTKEMT